MSRRVRLRLAGLLLAGLLSAPAGAHELQPIYVQLQEQDDGAVMMQAKTPLALTPPAIVMPAGCVARGEPLRLRQSDALLERRRYRCSDGLAGGTLAIDHGADAAPAVTVLVQAQLADGAAHTHLIPAGADHWQLPRHETPGAVAFEYLRLGIEHIWLGLDHLLFVACLLFIARTPRRLLLTITGFTLAHSLTLALSVLGWVRLPIAPVEAAIALSIVFLACEIARPRADSWTWRQPVLVSSLFGLLHGFGFAAVLREIGLPQTQLPAALFAFNLGVEVGQLLFVAVCLLAWAVLRRAPLPRQPALPIYAVGSVAAFWFLDRVSGFVA